VIDLTTRAGRGPGAARRCYAASAMSVLRAALYVTSLCGCAQLLGIDETRGPASTMDAPPIPQVSVQVQRISVGATAARAPYDVSQLTASFLVADGSTAGFHRVAGVALGDTWLATVPDGDPAMEIGLGLDYPDAFRRLYVLPQRNLKVLYGVYEHPGAVPAPAGAALGVTIKPPAATAANETFQLYAMGAWASHGLVTGTDFAVGATTIGPLTVPYAAAAWASTSGRPLSQITAADQVVALRYVGAQLTGAGEFPPFDQAATGTTPISATMTAVAAAAMDVHVAPATIATRLGMPTPKGVTLAMNWSVNAAPGWEIANGTGPQLQAGAVAAGDPGALALPFGNPFVARGWRSTFTWATSKARTFAVPSLANLPGTFYCGINQIAEVAPGLVADAPAALPVLVSINGTPLASDGSTIALDPARPVQLTMVADKPAALFYQFNLYELRANVAGTAVEPHVAYVVVTATPTVTIPGDVFVVGKTYQLRAHTILGGYPTFAAGDLWNRALPYSVGYLDAGVFTVSAM
jgi:hypothetical protein